MFLHHIFTIPLQVKDTPAKFSEAEKDGKLCINMHGMREQLRDAVFAVASHHQMTPANTKVGHILMVNFNCDDQTQFLHY